jgi:hypothetical protein
MSVSPCLSEYDAVIEYFPFECVLYLSYGHLFSYFICFWFECGQIMRHNRMQTVKAI